MTTLSRRRRSADEEPEEDTPRRSRRSRDEEPEDERPTRSRRSSREEPEDEDERPSRSRRSRSAEPDDDRPSRSRRSSREDEDEKPSRRRGGRATGGFSNYSQKRKANSKFADEFKPESDKEVLIKFLDAEPFDVYNQHWIDEMGKGERKSYVCLDDPDYFGDEADDGCPLCALGDNPSTFSLFNILDLSNPRKPQVKVWKTSVTVADKLERLAGSSKTSPLDRDDLYFAVTLVKTKNKTTWDLQPVKARDLEEDFDIEPFDGEELAEFDPEKFDDRQAVQQVDDFDALDDIAQSLD